MLGGRNPLHSWTLACCEKTRSGEGKKPGVGESGSASKLMLVSKSLEKMLGDEVILVEGGGRGQRRGREGIGWEVQSTRRETQGPINISNLI